MRHATVLAIGLLVLASGCVAFTNTTGPGTASGDEGRYDGAECHKRSWRPDSPEDGILLRACAGQPPLYAYAVDASIAVGKRHRAFDDRHPDQLAAAYNVIDCAKDCGADPLATGITAYYAGILDPDALRKQIAPVKVSDDAKAAFVDRAMGAKQQIVAAAAKLDPRRRQMYIESVAAVVGRRNAYFDAHRALYTRLDTLEARAKAARTAGRAPADLVKGLEQVRADYLATCESDACRFDPFVIETTRQLVLLHIAAGEDLAARAENALLTEKAAGRHLFSVETGTAVYQAMTEDRHAYDLYARARDAGMDAETLAARFGDPPPVKVDPSTDYIGSDQLPDMTRVLDPGSAVSAINVEGGIVAAVTPAHRSSAHGEPLSSVAFRPNVSTEDIESCYETGRVSGVHFEGSHAELEYESVCDVVGKRTHVDRVAPVFVPTSEVMRVRPGEHLEAMVDTSHQGLVIRSTARHAGSSRAPTPVLQIRGVRLPRP